MGNISGWMDFGVDLYSCCTGLSSFYSHLGKWNVDRENMVGWDLLLEMTSQVLLREV